MTNSPIWNDHPSNGGASPLEHAGTAPPKHASGWDPEDLAADAARQRRFHLRDGSHGAKQSGIEPLSLLAGRHHDRPRQSSPLAYLIGRNPVIFSDPVHVEPYEPLILDAAQARAFLDAAANERLSTVFVLLIALGIRVGEVLALTGTTSISTSTK
jgi:integrase